MIIPIDINRNPQKPTDNRDRSLDSQNMSLLSITFLYLLGRSPYDVII